jgi:hypothetical protein
MKRCDGYDDPDREYVCDVCGDQLTFAEVTFEELATINWTLCERCHGSLNTDSVLENLEP